MAESSKVTEEQTVHHATASMAGANGPSCESGNDQSKPSPSSETNNDVAFEPKLMMPEASEVVLERLARQVEYYFSTANLDKDTYLSTLRSLNDGYVPISIIANFAKVKSLVPYDSLNSVRKAAEESSHLLEVVLIDTQTGKRMESIDSSHPDSTPNTLDAVGPISGEPIPMDKLSSMPVSPSVTKSVAPIQNTVIIREVPGGTVESHIRELFIFEKCPAIKSLHLDVANCWFVTLDTSSRDDMLNVMFELRKQKFSSGDSVKARLKSGVSMTSELPSSFAFVNPDGTPLVYTGHGANRYLQGGSRKNKKKKNSSHKSRTCSSANGEPKNVKGKNNNNNSNRRNAGNKQKTAERQQKAGGRSNQSVVKPKSPAQQAPPPTFGEEQFPALPSEDSLSGSSKIEVEKVPDHDSSSDRLEKNLAGSDTASTATTSSSSSSSKLAVMGGYAAALLKAAPPVSKPVETSASKVNKAAKKNETSVTSMSRPKLQRPKGNVEENVEPVQVQPPSWGGGRSFADILRKETETASAAATAGQ